jgi:hypothetical protein
MKYATPKLGARFPFGPRTEDARRKMDKKRGRCERENDRTPCCTTRWSQSVLYRRTASQISP